ncbi:ABC transporter permease [Solicola gregarius]|uniref:ABC transporter permease n=1 Tax=Solicola gregarius TaxID=2908642 RepID=A0AA46TIF6_9ACTN|nr:ABC transporter permease [Solicola gregarius]UYM05449.1 ABC transporter permease [Solicola gregarius]
MRNDAAWRIVAGREVSTRLRDKGFLGGTAFMLLVIVAIFVIMQFVGGKATTYDVAVIDDQGTTTAKAASAIVEADDSDDSVSAKPYDTADDAERAVRDGDVDVALLPADDGYELVAEDTADDTLHTALATAVSKAGVEANAQQQGVDLKALQAGTSLHERSLDPDADTSDARSGIAFAFALIFYITALSFGMMISQSVVQEKESRVVEILAAAVPIRALLWGKVVGNTLLGLAQVVLVVAVGLAGLAATGRTDLLSGVGPAAAWYVLFFVLGFVTLASLWSVAGSIASRQQDLQSTTLPGQVILFAPYLVAVFAGEQVKTVVSMLPVVSSMLMPGRMVEGDVPMWQVAVAVVVTIASAFAFVRIGTRLYERTLLKTGTTIGYREAFKLQAD